ncbi:neuromedin-u receptor [Plakobranchus ocellatus]|uniref:Neuromedin-u receptor n=1 Tax=Plakobranchus ocellatus TaxID=259542 RepID=A0AAV3YR20_9GAST|nr:neuromedin-u receptor [Plakobranchus ocellatus]
MESARTIILLNQLTSTTPVTPPLHSLHAESAPDSAFGVITVTFEPATTTFNNTTDINALLVDKLGPRRKDMISVVLLTLVYSLIFLSGVVGNVCTCLVIARTHSMQTTTNYYLFSLAVSDLLLILIGEYILYGS